MQGYKVTDEELKVLADRYLAIKWHGWGSLTVKVADHKMVDVASTNQDSHDLLKAIYNSPPK